MRGWQQNFIGIRKGHLCASFTRGDGALKVWLSGRLSVPLPMPPLGLVGGLLVGAFMVIVVLCMMTYTIAYMEAQKQKLRNSVPAPTAPVIRTRAPLLRSASEMSTDTLFGDDIKRRASDMEVGQTKVQVRRTQSSTPPPRIAAFHLAGDEPQAAALMKPPVKPRTLLTRSTSALPS